ncbi:MAG: AAA family ATPase, partial [Chloroflexota bacterium]
MGQDIFINHIKVDNLRNLSGLEICLSEFDRKHLIITGKNGSGKTTLLLELNKFLEKVSQGHYQEVEFSARKQHKEIFQKQVEQLKNNPSST